MCSFGIQHPRAPFAFIAACPYATAQKRSRARRRDGGCPIARCRKPNPWPCHCHGQPVMSALYPPRPSSLQKPLRRTFPNPHSESPQPANIPPRPRRALQTRLAIVSPSHPPTFAFSGNTHTHPHISRSTEALPCSLGITAAAPWQRGLASRLFKA